MHARFYAPGALQAGDSIDLPPEEARHLARVLRLKSGDAVTVFNGAGAQFSGVVEAVGRSTAIVRLVDVAPARAESPVRVTLAQAVLKGDKMDQVVRDAVMMGVTAIHPIVTTRSEVPQAALARGRREERWQRIAIASAKQCGRAVVPVVYRPAGLDAVADWPAPRYMLLEPGASPAASPLTALPPPAPAEATIIVGPEGGWTPAEVEAGLALAHGLLLGDRTLRADAAAMVALAALLAHWGAL